MSPLLLFFCIVGIVARGLLPLRYGCRSLVILHRDVTLVGGYLHTPIDIGHLKLSP